MKKLHSSPLLPIFITVFLDMLGVTLLIPVLPALFFQDTGHFFSPEESATTRSILFGLLLAIYPFMQFFGAPLLGSLSDRCRSRLGFFTSRTPSSPFFRAWLPPI